MSIQEKPLLYGEGGRGLAIVTLPEELEGAPVVFLFNAGLLHRAEPYRLSVLTARRLAKLGYICVRFDLSGKGDTPVRDGLTNRESVALDYKHLADAVERQYGGRTFILFGLCSGADNSIKTSAYDRRVRGLILLDAESPQDAGFARRQLIQRLSNRRKWLRLPAIILRRLRGETGAVRPDLGLRDLPRPDDLAASVKNLVELDGRVLAVFTSHAISHYNQAGQFARAVGVAGFEKICTEHFWPDTEHLYPVAAHRTRLLDAVEQWGRQHFALFSSKGPAA